MSQNEPNFYGLGIAPAILSVIERLKFTTPTKIQYQAIPIGLQGQDVMGIAQTGTGKTIAFGIPLIQRLAQIKGRALVVVPTRELAIQVDESLRKIATALGMGTVVLIGGDSMGKQIQHLRSHPRILIGTPGRLIDHMQQKTLNLHDIHILVLDEADRMLDMGFGPQIATLLKQVPQDRQTMLFSATMPETIVNIAKSYMKLPVRVEVAPAGTMADKISQELFIVRKEFKNQLLESTLAQYKGSVLIFCRTKFGVARLTRQLRHAKHNAAETHSDRSLGQRKEALEGFKRGKYRILVATDIAARGIDVKGIELVINYDLPDDPENYVHRIGRTGRAGFAGHAASFATPDQRLDVKNIERIINQTLPVAQSHPTIPLEKFHQPKAPVMAFQTPRRMRLRRR
ncbi:MAG: DEAD/DEAH box helicase [Candidatus Omnitrophica bacterium]|nr:DEAD/DEAH box helicase [Candidatus Omnitrophota bacterium]MDE2009087.1 DEAD/DEAH box helicase [Candidatus Omnitrophota bacterium]MDE2214248.1 DEAD/DEAH box helicase [Candidatus Omnitrophota bacterium]MDE2231285.1 DEAD/DEAH box helicase [Candidatus Omnitrophota bacterium]